MSGERSDVQMADVGLQAPARVAPGMNISVDEIRGLSAAQIGRLVREKANIPRKVRERKYTPDQLKAVREAARQKAIATRKRNKEAGIKLSSAQIASRIEKGKRVMKNPGSIQALRRYAKTKNFRVSNLALTELYRANLDMKILDIAMQVATTHRRKTVKPEDVQQALLIKRAEY
jgi:histone H3/H4